jgi:hypothetical protein
MPFCFLDLLGCLVPCKARGLKVRSAPYGFHAGRTRRTRKLGSSASAAESNLQYSVLNEVYLEDKDMKSVESVLPSHTPPPRDGASDDHHVSQAVVQSSEELVPKGCKCGTTESAVFSVPDYATKSTIRLTITWIPCPVHPCLHSLPEDAEGPPLTESSSETSSIEEKRCLCNIYDQMRADPVASKLWYNDQCSIEFPSWVYATPYSW